MTLLILSLLPAMACVITAGILAYKGIWGWGWFLFVAILMFPALKSFTIN